MVTVVPGITGRIDRLEKSGFVTRERCAKDRRVIYAAVTERGRKTLAALDEPLQALHRRPIGHLSKADLKALTALPEKARGSLSAGGKRPDNPPDSCPRVCGNDASR